MRDAADARRLEADLEQSIGEGDADTRAHRNKALDHHVAWLDRRHGPAADPVLDAALSRTRRTRQLPGWLLPERWLPMRLATRMASVPRLVPVLLIIGLLLAAAVAVAIVGSQRRLPPPFGLAAPGLVAFVADGDLWTANPDGSNRARLTTDPRIPFQCSRGRNQLPSSACPLATAAGLGGQRHRRGDVDGHPIVLYTSTAQVR
jgi:hypothetical protein